jgi:hypothetical protein
MTDETKTESEQDIENENSTESSTEQTDDKETGSSTSEEDTSSKKDEDEKDPPWHKDPRFQEFIDQKNTFGADLEEFKKWKEQEAAKEASSLDKVVVPAWFGGGNQNIETKKLYKDFLTEQDERVIKATEERVFNRIKSEEESKAKALADANKWFEDSVGSIETKFKTKVDRNKLLKFVMDNELIDSKGRWNYEKGYEFMSAMSGKKDSKNDTTERKQFAGMGNGNGGGDQTAKDVSTSEDFSKPANRPW